MLRSRGYEKLLVGSRAVSRLEECLVGTTTPFHSSYLALHNGMRGTQQSPIEPLQLLKCLTEASRSSKVLYNWQIRCKAACTSS